MSDEQPKKGSKKKRVVCGLCVAAVWLVAIFLLPIWALAGLIAVSAGVCLYELCAMLRKAGYALPFGALAVATAGWFGLAYWLILRQGVEGLLPLAAAFPIFVMALFFRVLLDDRVQKPMETAALTAAAFVYIPFMLSFLLPIAMGGARELDGTLTHSHSPGIFLAFALILVTKLSDTGGYFVGTALGRHKMCPRLSPGKSWEGTVGGYAFSFVGAGLVIGAARLWPDAVCLGAVRALTDSPTAVAWAFLTVAVIVTVGICGDLLESLFKRQCGVKDSSALFPSMGGFFDTFDSIIFVPATFLFMAMVGESLLG